MAQVTFVEDAFQENNSDGSTSTTVSKPTGTQDGDLLITVLGNTDNLAITLLSGWTALDNISDTGADVGRVTVYWKIASSEGSDYTWSHAGLGANQALQFHVSAWRNAHATAPLAIYSTRSEDSAGTSMSGTGITTDAAPQGVLLSVFANENNGTIASYAVANNNPTWTELSDVATTNSAGIIHMGIAYANYDLAQATGAPTATSSGSSQYLSFFMFIRPAGFSFTPPLASLSLSGIVPAIVATITVSAVGFATIAGYAPTTSTADPEIVNVAKNTASMTNVSKNAATAANTSKTSSTWSNTQKS